VGGLEQSEPIPKKPKSVVLVQFGGVDVDVGVGVGVDIDIDVDIGVGVGVYLSDNDS
jgi:hypothetical protein